MTSDQLLLYDDSLTMMITSTSLYMYRYFPDDVMIFYETIVQNMYHLLQHHLYMYHYDELYSETNLLLYSINLLFICCALYIMCNNMFCNLCKYQKKT